MSLTFRRKARDWVDRAPTCECGRRCVLKTRRGDAPAPAFALNTRSDGVMDAEDGKTPVMYYYTCDPVNGGEAVQVLQAREGGGVVREAP